MKQLPTNVPLELQENIANQLDLRLDEEQQSMLNDGLVHLVLIENASELFRIFMMDENETNLENLLEGVIQHHKANVTILPSYSFSMSTDTTFESEVVYQVKS